MLQGVTSFQLDATPTWALSQSPSPIPTARSIARAGARFGPSVTSVERGFIGLVGFDMATNLGAARAKLRWKITGFPAISV